MDFLRKVAMKKLPVWLITAIIVIWTIALVSCTIVPTSYTTTKAQKNLVKKNTVFQIEFYRRYNKMDDKTKKEFLSKNIEFAIEIEKIICGKNSPEILNIWKKMKEAKQ